LKSGVAGIGIRFRASAATEGEAMTGQPPPPPLLPLPLPPPTGHALPPPRVRVPAPEKGITCGLTSVLVWVVLSKRKRKKGLRVFRSPLRRGPSSLLIETSHRFSPPIFSLSLPFEHGLPLPVVDAIDAKRR
jgi:hypothetical protein